MRWQSILRYGCVFVIVTAATAWADPPSQLGFPVALPGTGFAPVVGDVDDNGDLEIVSSELRILNDIDAAMNPRLYLWEIDGTSSYIDLVLAHDDPSVIVKILSHLGLPTRAPPRSPAGIDEFLQTA